VLHRVWQGIGRPGKKLEQVARFDALGQIEWEDAREQDDAAVDEALAAFGLVAVRTVEKFEPLYLWPENIPSWELFRGVSTQWVIGPGGLVGLNYQGVEVVMRKRCIKRSDESRLFSDIQVMERATLNAWSERKK
jgi:hypothetical protein